MTGHGNRANMAVAADGVNGCDTREEAEKAANPIGREAAEAVTDYWFVGHIRTSKRISYILGSLIYVSSNLAPPGGAF